jgi:hypothetical protein
MWTTTTTSVMKYQNLCGQPVADIFLDDVTHQRRLAIYNHQQTDVSITSVVFSELLPTSASVQMFAFEGVDFWGRDWTVDSVTVRAQCSSFSSGFSSSKMPLVPTPVSMRVI